MNNTESVKDTAKKTIIKATEVEDIVMNEDAMSRALDEKVAVKEQAPPKILKPIAIKDIKNETIKVKLQKVGVGFHRDVGYISPKMILFPILMKTKKFHIGFTGDVVVTKCPVCGFRNSASDAIKGKCANEKVAPLNEPCGYDAVEELNEVDDPKELDGKLI